MTSKVSSTTLQNAIHTIMTEGRKRHFVQTIELQVGLKNWDVQKDKRFSGVVRLPNPCKKSIKVCILGDQVHLDEAKKLGLPCMGVDGLKTIGRNKKPLKKLCKKYNCFLASETVLRQIPKLNGPAFNRAGKFPTVIQHTDDLAAKVLELQSQVKFQMKKSLCLGVAVANVSLTEEQVQANIERSINFLISLLKKGWQNIKSLYIKTSMGAPVRIY